MHSMKIPVTRHQLMEQIQAPTRRRRRKLAGWVSPPTKRKDQLQTAYITFIFRSKRTCPQEVECSPLLSMRWLCHKGQLSLTCFPQWHNRKRQRRHYHPPARSSLSLSFVNTYPPSPPHIHHGNTSLRHILLPPRSPLISPSIPHKRQSRPTPPDESHNQLDLQTSLLVRPRPNRLQDLSAARQTPRGTQGVQR